MAKAKTKAKAKGRKKGGARASVAAAVVAPVLEPAPLVHQSVCEACGHVIRAPDAGDMKAQESAHRKATGHDRFKRDRQ